MCAGWWGAAGWSAPARPVRRGEEEAEHRSRDPGGPLSPVPGRAHFRCAYVAMLVLQRYALPHQMQPNKGLGICLAMQVAAVRCLINYVLRYKHSTYPGTVARRCKSTHGAISSRHMWWCPFVLCSCVHACSRILDCSRAKIAACVLTQHNSVAFAAVAVTDVQVLTASQRCL